MMDVDERVRSEERRTREDIRILARLMVMLLVNGSLAGGQRCFLPVNGIGDFQCSNY